VGKIAIGGKKGVNAGRRRDGGEAGARFKGLLVCCRMKRLSEGGCTESVCVEVGRQGGLEGKGGGERGVGRRRWREPIRGWSFTIDHLAYISKL